MKTFQDANGKSWQIVVNVGTIKHVRDTAEVDLLDLKDGAIFERLSSDPVVLCRVLWALCENQAHSSGITEMQFYESMTGDAIELATVALMDDLVDFFPKAKRVLLADLLRKLRTVQSAAINHAAKMLEAVDIEKIALEASGNQYTNAPESSE